MALVFKTSNLIIICVHRNIYVYNSELKTCTSTSLPAIVKRDPKNEEAKDGEVNENENNNQNGKEANQSLGHITHACVSECGNLLAVATGGNKVLFVLVLDSERNLFEVKSKYELVRGCSALRFSPDSKLVLLADKTGDCYEFQCSGDETHEKGKWLLGHFSMVLDILMTSDQKYIITCDRDEKIRITHYPKTHIIETYCLGHLEFVSSIELLHSSSEPLLMSVSGDKTLRLWNYIDGKELLSKEIPSPGVNLAINESNHVAVVLLENPIKIQLYDILQDGSSRDFRLLAEHTFDEIIKRITSVVLEKNDDILLTCVNDSDKLGLKKLTIQQGSGYNESTLVDVMNELTNLMDLKVGILDDLSILFKKKFDNLKEYHEKKKRRIEQKLTK